MHAPSGSFKQMADHHLSSSKAQDLEQSSLSDLVFALLLMVVWLSADTIRSGWNILSFDIESRIFEGINFSTKSVTHAFSALT
jgi:hypothetical protein